MRSFVVFNALCIISLLSSTYAVAQLSLSAQLRTRSELRDGQGAPLPAGADAAFFTSQRTRLTAGYNMYRLKMGITVQDTRVWGQDVSTINKSTTADNNGLMLHEAWAEIRLTDTSYKKSALTLKIGRQELVYDDQRLIGNLDWLQQARRHDAAVLQFTGAAWKLHAGFAFNQNREKASGTRYDQTPPGNYPGNTNSGSSYKSFEYLYASRSYQQGNISFLFFSDQFNKFHTLTENDIPVKIWDKGNWNRITTGVYVTGEYINNTQVTAAAYYQAGKTATGQQLSAGLLSLQAMYKLSEQVSAGGGVDYTTGGESGTVSYAFDPLYGTPHKFWGLMDYFYAGSGFGSKGLQDYYIKTKYKLSEKLQVAVDIHRFSSASTVRDASRNKLSRYFGTEMDMVCNYTLTNMIGFEAGYSHFFSSPSLSSPEVKNITAAQKNNNWAYLMINIRPAFSL